MQPSSGIWLDRLVTSVNDMAREGHMGSDMRKAAKTMTPYDLFMAMCRHAAMEAVRFFHRYPDIQDFVAKMGGTGDGLDPNLAFQHNVAGMGAALMLAVPGIFDDTTLFRPKHGGAPLTFDRHYLSVDPEVCADLFGHKSPELPDFWGTWFPESAVCYMDFGDCDLRIGPGHRVLAMVVGHRCYMQPASTEKMNERDLPSSAVEAHIVIEHNVGRVDAYNATHIYGDLRYPDSMCGVLFSPEVRENMEAIADNLRHLFQSCWLLYKERGATLAPARPTITRDELARTKRPDKQRSKLHVFSLFSMRRLASAKRLVPAHARQGGEHKLTYRYTVRGHLRWQACGKAHAERKLIWIDPHPKGPIGAPVKLSMTRVNHA